MDYDHSIVLDLGSGCCKAGFGGDDTPRAVFPMLMGTPNQTCVIPMYNPGRSKFVGDSANSYRGLLALRYPIRRGIVRDWNDMETLLHDILHNQLRILPEEYGVLFTEPCMNPVAHRANMAELMLEKFNIPRVFCALAPILAVYASGRNTAMVVDIGDGVANSMPISSTWTVERAIWRMDLAGSDLTQYFQRLILEQGFHLSTSAELQIVQDMKEKLCYVALDYEKELEDLLYTSQLSKTYELPDGQVITLSEERFKCPEALFKPDLLGRPEKGIHEMIYESVMKCPIDLRKDFVSNIVLSGGTTLFPGIEDRLYKELTQLFPSTLRIKIVSPPERKYSVWIGGSILASLSTFQASWISRKEWDEEGPAVMQRKRY